MPKPTKPPKDTDATSRADSMEMLASEVKKQLPGWRIAREESAADLQNSKGSPLTVRGATLGELRRKYLPAGDQDAVDSVTPADYMKPASGKQSFRVEPEGGGPSKVADLDKGQIKLVQG
jgi:hypothetical protein